MQIYFPKRSVSPGAGSEGCQVQGSGQGSVLSAWREQGHGERQARLRGATYMSPASSLGGLSKHQPQRAESAQAEQDQPALAP